MKNKNALHITGTFGLLLLIVIYSACNNSNTSNNNSKGNSPASVQKINLIAQLIGNGKGLFRSVDLEEDIHKVSATENKIPDENDTDYISYTFPIDTLQPDSVNEPIDSVNYYKVTYYFDKSKLNEIDEDIFLESDSSAASLSNRLTEYFSSKYGEYASRNDSRIWSIPNKNKKEWVSLSDQSVEYYGKLELVLYSEE